MLVATQYAGFGAGGEPPYIANAVNFDGTNDWLQRSADLTGNADDNEGVISFWINFQGGDGAKQTVYRTSGGYGIAERSANNKFHYEFWTPGNSLKVKIDTVNTYTVASGWLHFLASWDNSGTPRARLYINDVSDKSEVTLVNGSVLDYTRANHGVGADPPGGGTKINADLADFYGNFGTFLDFDTVANRRLFIDSAGKPVDLGNDGSTPTGTAPIMYFSGPTVDWHTNKGTGGGFTENGALTDATTSPSD